MVILVSCTDILAGATSDADNCPVAIPKQPVPVNGNPILQAFKGTNQQAMFDRYNCLQALYPEAVYANFTKVNPWLYLGDNGSQLQVRLSNGWCGSGNTNTAVCTLSSSNVPAECRSDQAQPNGNCENSGIPISVCSAIGINASIEGLPTSWTDMELIPLLSSQAGSSTEPSASAGFAIFSVVPPDIDTQFLERYFPTYTLVRTMIAQFVNGLAPSIPETSLGSQFGPFIKNVSPEEGEYILRSAYDACIVNDLATSFNTCMLQSPGKVCVTKVVQIAQRIEGNSAGIPQVDVTSQCAFSLSGVAYKYICDDRFTGAPGVQVLQNDVVSQGTPVRAIEVQILHKCFCDGTSLDECSSARQNAVKEKNRKNLLDALVYVFVVMPPLSVLGILLIEFHHKKLFWRWRRDNSRVSWRSVKSLVSGIISNMSPLQLLTSQVSHAHTVQIITVWLLLFNIILFAFMGIGDDNEWLFAYEVVMFYLPLTLCASSSMKIRGGTIGLIYTIFLMCFLITFEEVSTLDPSDLQSRLHILNSCFTVIPLSLLLVYFIWQISSELWNRRQGPRDSFETAFSVAPLGGQWYYKYVKQVFVTGYEHSQHAHIPGSARVILAIVVSIVGLAYISILIGLVVTYGIDAIPSLAGGACHLGFSNMDPATRWEYEADTANSTTAEAALPCSTLQSVVTILRGVVVGLWVLCVAGTVPQLGFLYRHYQKDMATLIQGKRECFPNKSIPKPVTALLGSLNFVGFHIVATMMGIAVIFIVLFVTLCLILVVVVLPYVNIGFPAVVPIRYVSNMFYNPDSNQIGWISMLIIVKAIQRLFVGYAVLEDKKRSIQLRNRHAFEYMDFLLIAIGVLGGIFKFLARSAQSVGINLAHMLRTDAVVVPRGFDHYDVGFKCYTGMLAVDRFYCNPILLLAIDFFKLIAHRNVSQLFMKDAEEHNGDGELTMSCSLSTRGNREASRLYTVTQARCVRLCKPLYTELLTHVFSMRTMSSVNTFKTGRLEIGEGFWINPHFFFRFLSV